MGKKKLDQVLEQLEDSIDTAAVLTTKKRDAIKSGAFAVPGKRKLPIHDCSHARNAAARLNQTQGLTSDEKRIARQRIQRKLASCRGKD